MPENHANDHAQLADFPKERKVNLTPHISRNKTPLMTLETGLNLLTERLTCFSSFISAQREDKFTGEEEQCIGAYTCICMCFQIDK